MCPLGVGVVGGEKEGGRLQGHIAARNDIDSLERKERGREEEREGGEEG